MEEIKMLIGSNDQKLKLREQRFIQEVNTAYEKAVEKSIREFKKLEKLSVDTKLNSREVKLIVARALAVFQAEFEVLSEPLKEAMVESYEEGLSETGQILAALDRSKE